MQDVKTIASVGRSLARNPLGIIALFIVLVYAFAALTLAAGTNLQPLERTALVLFLVLFPVIVLAVFCWLVIGHHQKLYAPADYKSDEGFLAGLRERERRTLEFAEEQQEVIKTRVTKSVTESSRSLGASPEKAAEIAERVLGDVQQATTITIDARNFLSKRDAIRTYPISAFSTLGWLVEEALRMIEPTVGPYEYGYSWILRNTATGDVVEHARLITRTARGVPIDDHRSLGSTGIRGGATLVVECPPQSAASLTIKDRSREAAI